MQATTVKLDGALVQKLKRLKSPDETFSAFVRAILASEVRRRAARQAAEAYVKFLDENATEAASMDEWATAALDRQPAVRKKR
jgi:predicted transcriptional regulator